VDCIKRGRLQPKNKQTWATGSLIFMSMAMSFNLVLIMILLQEYVLKNYFYKLYFSSIPDYLNNVISYILLFVLPCFIINHILIFRNKRYEKLLQIYPYYDGRLFLSYFLISMSLPIILLWVGIIFFRS